MILSSALFSATIPGGIQLWLCPVTEGAERVGGRAGGWVVGSPADGFLCQDLSPWTNFEQTSWWGWQWQCHVSTFQLTRYKRYLRQNWTYLFYTWFQLRL